MIPILAAITTLTGCTSTAPRVSLEELVSVPESWSAPLPASAAVQDVEPEGPWWQAFGDPALSTLIDEALEHNRDLQAAAARLAQAAARARIAGAPLAPQVSAGLDGARGKRNFIGFPIPGGGGVLSTTSTTVGVALNVSWEADLWGRLRAGRLAAREDLAAAAEEYRAARLSLSGQTAKAWLAAVEAAQQVALAESTLESRHSTAQRVERRYVRGLRSPLDLRLARADEAGARAALAGRERQADATRRQLEVLLGRYPAGAFDAGTELPAPAAGALAGLPSELVVRRPDLRAAERRLAAAGARVAEARRALYPQLRLTGSTGTTSDDLADLLDGDFSVWSAAAGLLQPLFQGGRLRAGVDLGEAGRDEAFARYAAAVLGAFAEVETSLAAETFLARREEALETAAREAAAAQRLAEERYAEGLADYLGLLESQRQASQARSQLIEARRQRLEARVDLHLALGGSLGDVEISDDPSPVTAALAPPEEAR